ncbi:hypothetical protein SCMC78_04670 [Streptomyces sp. CMC78]|uniref:Uncharacterized protein n=1 Tax=Streptomyces sp. CMC78 TaxID=3231512 RepID=A0AB33K923_9ACTN
MSTRIRRYDGDEGLPCGVCGLRLALKFYSGPRGAHGGAQRVCDMCAGGREVGVVIRDV